MDEARIRMEGGLERLEQSVALLEFARLALERAIPLADDLVTLRQLNTEWKSLEEALSMARQYESCQPVVLAVDAGLSRLSLAVQARLGGEPLPLREAIAEIIETLSDRLMSLTGRETLLLASPPPKTKTIPIALLTGVCVGFASQVPEAGLIAALIVWLALSTSPRSSWLLTTDRLRITRVLRGVTDIPLRAVKRFDRHRQKLIVDGAELETPLAAELESALRLLCTEWFIGSRAEAPSCVIAPAVRGLAEQGGVLVLSDGALFIPLARLVQVQQALAGGPLEALPVERFLLLLAHVRERWDFLVAELEKFDADWLPRHEAEVRESADAMGVSIRSGMVEVTITAELSSGGAALVQKIGTLLRHGQGAP